MKLVGVPKSVKWKRCELDLSQGLISLTDIFIHFKKLSQLTDDNEREKNAPLLQQRFQNGESLKNSTAEFPTGK